jgi:hypothetical protein
MPQSQQQQDDHVYHAFTTGRRSNNTQNSSFTKKPRPKGPSQTLKVSFAVILLVSYLKVSLWFQQPGKLNLKTFAMVNEAISRMNMGDNAASDKERKHSKTGNLYSTFYHQLPAPLAAPEEEDASHTNGDSSGGEHQPSGNGGYIQFRDDFGSVASNLFTSCYAPAHNLKVKGQLAPQPPPPPVPKVKNSMLRQLASRRRDLSEQQSKLLDIAF